MVSSTLATCDPVRLGSDNAGGDIHLRGHVNGADRDVHVVGDRCEIIIAALVNAVCAFAGNRLTLDTSPCQLVNVQMTDLSSSGHLADGWRSIEFGAS